MPISIWRLCWNLNGSHSPLRLELRRCKTFVIFCGTLAPVKFALFQRCLKNIQIPRGAQGPRSKADLLMKKGVAVGKREVWVRNTARRLRAGRDFRVFGFLIWWLIGRWGGEPDTLQEGFKSPARGSRTLTRSRFLLEKHLSWSLALSLEYVSLIILGKTHPIL